LARAAGRPVKVVWTREEEFTWAYFRPAGVIEIKSGISGDGTLTAWEFHNYHSGSSGLTLPTSLRISEPKYHAGASHFAQRVLRGLAATANHFARAKPTWMRSRAWRNGSLDFRMKNLSNPRMRAVLEAAAKSFGWPRKKRGTDKGSESPVVTRRAVL